MFSNLTTFGKSVRRFRTGQFGRVLAAAALETRNHTSTTPRQANTRIARSGYNFPQSLISINLGPKKLHCLGLISFDLRGKTKSATNIVACNQAKNADSFMMQQLLYHRLLGLDLRISSSI
jgi:hypothetical protein